MTTTNNHPKEESATQLGNSNVEHKVKPIGWDSGVYENMGENGFILIAENEAMWPRYHKGDHLHVNPDLVNKNGDHIIVKLSDSRIVFRICKGDYLEAMNPDWPEQKIKLDDNADVLGVVVNYV